MKKTIKIAKIALPILLMFIMATVLISVIVARINNQTPRIFGYSLHIVVTDSMSPDIKVGELVIAKQTDNAKIEVGDDIIFSSPDPMLMGIQIIHRVIEINEDGSFITKGTKQGAEVDKYPVKSIEGKLIYKSVFLGKVFLFFSHPINIVFGVVIVVFVVLIFKITKKVIQEI